MMKDNSLRKILSHPNKTDIIEKLSLGLSPKEVHQWLKEKYQHLADNSLVCSEKLLKSFKDEYLDLYQQIREDAGELQKQQETLSSIQEATSLVQSNPTYKAKLNEYLDKEIDIKTIVKNMVVGIEHRAGQIFDTLESNPTSFKKDYVLINWFNALTNVLEKYDAILNGTSDKITQQNNINIQIIDQYANIMQNCIKTVLSKLDYETSLLFVEMLNEELQKVKAPILEAAVEVRLEEARKLEAKIEKLDN